MEFAEILGAVKIIGLQSHNININLILARPGGCDGEQATRDELVARLKRFKKGELAILIADLIDNSDEH